MKRINYLIIIALFANFFFVLPMRAAQTITVNGETITIETPQPRISIPGVEFGKAKFSTTGQGTQQIIDVPFLGQYIASIYKFAVTIAGLIAVVMIIIAGFQWATSGGSADAISSAKKRISDAVVGLLLVFGSYAILYTINPDLVQFKSLQIQYVRTENIGYQTGGDTSTDGAGNTFNIENQTVAKQVSDLTIFCEKKGGTEAIPRVVQSLSHKIAYRMGGKGGPPPYTESGEYAQYKDYCPEGNMCFDCSGLIDLIYSCAGIPWIAGKSTADMFNSGSIVIKNSDIDYGANTVRGEDLSPGDLLGWRPIDDINKNGHVIMYIGNGQVVESFGGHAGRKANANPLVRNLSSFKGSPGYNFTRLRKVSE